MKKLLLLALICITSIASYAQLSKKEKHIASAIEKNNEEAVELLKRTVNMNSGTMNFEGVKAVGEVFMQELEELGLEVKWVDGKAWNRAGHLVATYEGSPKSPRILLIGHLDTVFEPESDFQSYTMMNDTLMKGPGVIDMKGGNVIIVQIVRALKDAGVLKDTNLEIIMMGDEERSGDPLDLARKDLREAAERADIALGFEDGDGDPKTVVVSRRGSQSWELLVKGIQAHSSQIFQGNVGAGAIYEASRILTEFYQKLQSMENLTFNPGLFLGGTQIYYDEKEAAGKASGKSNIVARGVIVKGDLRATSPEQLQKAMDAMKEIAKKNLPGTSAEIIFREGGYPPLAATEGNFKLLRMYSSVSTDLGYWPVDPVNPRNAGAADISFTSGFVDMAIDGLGLSGVDGHSPEETANLNMLPIQTKRAAILIYRLSKGIQ